MLVNERFGDAKSKKLIIWKILLVDWTVLKALMLDLIALKIGHVNHSTIETSKNGVIGPTSKFNFQKEHEFW